MDEIDADCACQCPTKVLRLAALGYGAQTNFNKYNVLCSVQVLLKSNVKTVETLDVNLRLASSHYFISGVFNAKNSTWYQPLSMLLNTGTSAFSHPL